MILASIAALLIVAFDASVTRLVQLYILGVFLSFTISQAGMVKHWTLTLRTALASERRRILRDRVINAVGAAVTALVLVIGYTELMTSASLIYARTYQTIPLLIVAALWYLAISAVLSLGQFYVERHYGRGFSNSRVRKEKVK